MKIPALSYTEYQSLGGKLSEEAFKDSYMAAQAWVRYYCGYNEAETEEDITAVKQTVVAAIAVDNAYGASGGVGESASSLSIGSFSVSGGVSQEPGASCYQQDMQRVIYMGLSGTGLLFGGLDA